MLKSGKKIFFLKEIMGVACEVWGQSTLEECIRVRIG